MISILGLLYKIPLLEVKYLLEELTLIVCKWLLPAKACKPILLTLIGIVIFVILGKLLKTKSPIVWIVSGSFTDFINLPESAPFLKTGLSKPITVLPSIVEGILISISYPHIDKC